MPIWLTESEHATLSAACDRLMPPDGDFPGAAAAGAPDYIDTLLGAFSFDPPRIWAGGPFSGRHGGEASFGKFHSLTVLDELAWRTRIEGSSGVAEREFNGPVTGYQQLYRAGLAALGPDFAGADRDVQAARLHECDHEFFDLLLEHTCEGVYGAPEYGGNRDLVGWRTIDYRGDVQPRGYTDEEVSNP